MCVLSWVTPDSRKLSASFLLSHKLHGVPAKLRVCLTNPWKLSKINSPCHLLFGYSNSNGYKGSSASGIERQRRRGPWKEK